MRGNNKGAKKMIASERYETILNLIQEQGIVKVKDLAKLMQVTETSGVTVKNWNIRAN